MFQSRELKGVLDQCSLNRALQCLADLSGKLRFMLLSRHMRVYFFSSRLWEKLVVSVLCLGLEYGLFDMKSFQTRWLLNAIHLYDQITSNSSCLSAFPRLTLPFVVFLAFIWEALQIRIRKGFLWVWVFGCFSVLTSSTLWLILSSSPSAHSYSSDPMDRVFHLEKYARKSTTMGYPPKTCQNRFWFGRYLALTLKMAWNDLESGKLRKLKLNMNPDHCHRKGEESER